MQDRQDSSGSRQHPMDAEALEQKEMDLESALAMFRSSTRTAAERPEWFWKKQHAVIMDRLYEPIPTRRPGRALAWSTAALAVLFCLFFLVQPSKAPAPDLPAGADQTLLIEVERELSKEYPEALMPAALLGDGTENLQSRQ